ncbi:MULTISPECIES: CrcB family protein [unclassified Corynebacterium]|uniref:FluC/FEX family fluoride channel n=1 Tax=unclassified Corynebacterium TaxID=2624378 RepID=UPI001EF45542|nr:MULTISPECIES: CrcB family protein [unclassified Corynebacterium]MCG7290171.1 CrcB family protein [Corynebacterium sp. ACRPZ]MCG7294322.1 CrcB family protein [Corynebacterium sp. ACRPY]
MADLLPLLIGAAAVFVGGMLGGFARWLLMRQIHSTLASTFAANVSAAAVIGFAAAAPGVWRIGIGVGFAGALSTLSMLARQLGEMVESGEFVLAVKYGVGTALAAIAASAVGVYGFG